MSIKVNGAINKTDNKTISKLLSFVKPKLLFISVSFFNFIVQRKAAPIIENVNTSIKIGGKG